MPGHGPAPKSPEARRRRNVPERGEWRELPIGAPAPPVLPTLPPRGDGETWSELARLKWEAWRTDPATRIYGPAEVMYALDTLRLYEGMTSSTANEIRLREDGLGLTPKGKRDLRLRVVEDELGAARAERAPARRPRLRVVAPEMSGGK